MIYHTYIYYEAIVYNFPIQKNRSAYNKNVTNKKLHFISSSFIDQVPDIHISFRELNQHFVNNLQSTK